MGYYLTIPGCMWLVIALPLIGAAVNGTLSLGKAARGWKIEHWLPALIGVGMPATAFLIVARTFYVLSSFDAGGFSPSMEPLFQWVTFGSWVIDVGIRVDQLSIIMTLVVTGVGSLIHLYSIGYMSHDKGFIRYFSYLNLFLFFMLLLVLGDNLLVMFVGWEGVGLCSYLLIGFWFEDPAKAYAGKKAFIVNRIGDFGFLLGIFLVWFALRSYVTEPGVALLNFATIQEYALRGDSPILPFATAICLLFFVGACGKSAQIPLYVWLPDAMAGPTPVSALIHAATMVTAGVYMVARLHFLYTLAPMAMAVVAWIGIITAFFAATMGLVQDDIKKVLAYSTVSQLGYMFVGVGVGAFSAGVFHLMTHAFFKALLFLGSGAVIHAMEHEQRMSRYGGLRKELPITFWTFFVATLAIAGVYPFAGFFSKDAILWNALHPTMHIPGHFWIWLLGVITAGMTAFYMFRAVGLTFFGKRTEAGKHIVCHREESVSMLVPLIILAVLSFVGGWIGVPAGFGGADHFHHFLAPIFLSASEGHNASMEMLVGLGTMLFVGMCGLISWTMYAQRSRWPATMAVRFSRLYKTLVGLYFVDQIYQALIVRPLIWISKWILWKFQDETVIDRCAVHGTGRLMLLVGRLSTVVQTGVTPHYVFGMVLGAVVVIGWLVL